MVLVALIVPLAADGAVAAQAADPIVLDGRLDEWSQRATLLVDPVDAFGAPLDIGRVAAADDPQWLHLLVDLRRPVGLQQLDGRLLLMLDADGDPTTGATERGMAGVDLVVAFTPPNPSRPDRPGMGVGVEWLRGDERVPLSPYALELAFAPTTVSEAFEIRLARLSDVDERPALDGARIRGRWLYLDRDGAMRDETEVFTHELVTTAAPQQPPMARTDPLERPRGTTARIVSWNLEHGGIFANPAPFARVLLALEPDVLLIQEFSGNDGADRLRAWLDENLPGNSWSVHVGAAGGDLRSAIATRLPMREVSSLERVSHERDGRPRDVRVSAAMVDVAGVETLFMSIHLKCCGGADGPEEIQRIDEVRAIADALGSVVEFGRPVVVGGDFNLVGGRGPMRPLVTEWGMAEADLLHLDGRAVATWFDADSPFTPGRLDYVLHCNASMASLGGFVLDTRHLAPRWLTRHGLERDDVRTASDHFPLVLDLAPRTSSARGAQRPAGAVR